MRLRFVLLSAMAFTLVGAASASQIALAPVDVIGNYGVYGGLFTAQAILDHQSGTINEPLQDGSYWLNPDNGPLTAFIVIDLGAAYHLASFDLFNTHNANFGDRGTGDFSIEASNSIGAGPVGSTGFDLSGGIVTLVSGTLSAASPSADPLSAQSFTSSDGGSYRYIRFSPHTVASSNASCCGANNYGLNELRAFETPAGTVPEPGSALLLAAGVAIVALRRRIA